MTWDQIEGSWPLWRGKIQEQYNQLTEEDLDRIEGRKDQLIGHLRTRYGLEEEVAELYLRSWMDQSV